MKDGPEEDGLLVGATANDNSKATKASLEDRPRVFENEPESTDEWGVTGRCRALVDGKSSAGEASQSAQAKVDQQPPARYAMLTETGIKKLVIQDKWLAAIKLALKDELGWLTKHLGGRFKELEERYVQSLLELEREVEAFGAKVMGHLQRMGMSSCGRDSRR